MSPFANKLVHWSQVFGSTALKVQMNFSDHLSSIRLSVSLAVCLSLVKGIQFFFQIKNTSLTKFKKSSVPSLDNFDQIWHKAFLDKVDLN